MGYDIRYLYPKTLDQDAGNYWFYEGDRANNTLADIVVNGFFNGSTVRDSDLIKVKATDGKSLLTIMIENGSVNTEVAGSGASASEVLYDDSVSPPYGASNVQDVLDILKSSSGAMLINNYRGVATNGVDSTVSPISLTLDNALTNLGSSGVVQVYDGTFDVPTVSLLNKQIIGIDKEKCIIEATSGTFPVSSNSNFIVSNITFLGTVSNPIPIVSNGNAFNIIFNDCIFIGNVDIGASFNNPTASTITFNRCKGYISFSGSASLSNITFNDCDVKLDINFTSGTNGTVVLNNCLVQIASWFGGVLNLNNPIFTASSNFGADSTINNYLYINNGTTKNMVNNNYHILSKSGVAPFYINNLDTVHRLNTYDGNGLILGYNDIIKNTSSNYTLLGWENLILVNTTAGDVTITLFQTSVFGDDELDYTIIKADETDNKLTIVVSGSDTMANGDAGSTTQYSTSQKNETVRLFAYASQNLWRRY